MTKAYVLDTSAFSAFNRKDPRLRKWFQPGKRIIMPLIVVAELRAGFAFGTKTEENVRLLRRFLDAPNVNTVTLTDTTAKLYATIFAALRRAGTPIGSNDMWIAALALEHDLSLLTLDSDFLHIPDLLVAKL